MMEVSNALTRERYRKYTLLAFILVVGVILFSEFSTFLSGFLGAFTVYILVRGQMKYFTEKKKMKNSLSAILILTEVLVCFLVPVFFVIRLIIQQVDKINIDIQSIIDSIQRMVRLLEGKTGYDILSSDNIATLATYSTKLGQLIVDEVSSFVINALVLLFVLYFMLISRKPMELYIYDILPFNDSNKRSVLNNINMLVKSNAIGIPLLAIIQGVIATVGYYIFDVPNPMLFGFITCFATLIPVFGTALVWFPLAIYLGINDDWFNAIGLVIYGILVVANVDNLVRFLLQKKMADTHPLITVFGVIIGISLFGFWGVIFGPLLLSIFFLCFNIFKVQYLDKKKKTNFS